MFTASNSFLFYRTRNNLCPSVHMYGNDPTVCSATPTLRYYYTEVYPTANYMWMPTILHIFHISYHTGWKRSRARSDDIGIEPIVVYTIFCASTKLSFILRIFVHKHDREWILLRINSLRSYLSFLSVCVCNSSVKCATIARLKSTRLGRSRHDTTSSSYKSWQMNAEHVYSWTHYSYVCSHGLSAALVKWSRHHR